MVYLSFNRFRIKGPTLGRDTLIGKKSRTTLLASRKTGMSYGAEIKSPLAPPCPRPRPLPPFPPPRPVRRYCADPTRRQLFLAGYGERRARYVVRSEKSRGIDTIELSCRKSLFQPSHSPSGGREREGERTRRSSGISVILISNES